MDTILFYSTYLFSKGVKGVLCLPRSSKHPEWLVWDAYRMLDTHRHCDGDGDGANLKQLLILCESRHVQVRVLYWFTLYNRDKGGRR